MDPRNVERDDLSSQLPACASCKHQRKRCTQDCVLAPFFPAHMKEEFEAVQQVFGVGKVVKALNRLPGQEEKRMAVESFIWEALGWKTDPEGGPLRNHRRVLEELEWYKKNERSSSLLAQDSYTGLLMVAGHGTGSRNGNGNGNGVVASGYASSNNGMMQNFHHNRLQNFNTDYNYDTNSSQQQQQHHSNGFGQPYLVAFTGPYNSVNNNNGGNGGNGMIVSSSLRGANTYSASHNTN